MTGEEATFLLFIGAVYSSGARDFHTLMDDLTKRERGPALTVNWSSDTQFYS